MAMIKILMIRVTKLTTMKMFTAETLQNSMAPNNETKGILHLSLEYIILKKSQVCDRDFHLTVSYEWVSCCSATNTLLPSIAFPIL